MSHCHIVRLAGVIDNITAAKYLSLSLSCQLIINIIIIVWTELLQYNKHSLEITKRTRRTNLTSTLPGLIGSTWLSARNKTIASCREEKIDLTDITSLPALQNTIILRIPSLPKEMRFLSAWWRRYNSLLMEEVKSRYGAVILY